MREQKIDCTVERTLSRSRLSEPTEEEEVCPKLRKETSTAE